MRETGLHPDPQVSESIFNMPTSTFLRNTSMIPVLYIPFIAMCITGLWLMLSSCNKNGDNPSGVPVRGILEQTHTYALPFPEPSGLTFGPNKNTLIAVSDTTNKVYEIRLDGSIIRTFSFTGNDLEGVTYNPDKNLIALVEEKKREVVLIDYHSGSIAGIHKIDVPAGVESNGLEGIAYNSQNKDYYIVNEMNPGLLLVWNPETGIRRRQTLGFAIDYSGIFIPENDPVLWITSDESETLYQCDDFANVLMFFDLPDSKLEGIAINNDIVYLVNDAKATLSIFRIKSN
jgi:DNA-binding beta-propeller fold protein YncE